MEPKKGKINETPSPTTSADPQKKNTAQTESEIKREPAPPPIMVHGLYREHNNQLSKESFQVEITNDEMVKINCNNSENYRKAIHVLQNCNFNFHTLKINKLDQFELWLVQTGKHYE
jgi:hypothetical protein